MKPKSAMITIGDRQIEVKRMNLIQLEEYLDLQPQVVAAGSLKEQLPVLRAGVLIAIKDAAPDVTDEVLCRELGLQELFEITEIIGQLSGMQRQEVGEPTEDPSIGPPSMVESQPALDGTLPPLGG